MTPFKLPIYLLLSIFVIACGKDKAKDDDKPDVPCLGFFSCKINGVPFENSGSASCSSLLSSYDSTNGILTIAGTDCRVWENGYGDVVVHVYNIIAKGTYHIGGANCAYIDNNGIYHHHNSLLEGQIKVTGFVASDYSVDWHGGYAEGTFWFTSYNEELQDTVYVTNGEFCGRL